MILLTSTSDKLTITTTTTADIHCHASWLDFASSTVTPGRTNTLITSISSPDLVGVPGSSTQRNVKSIHIKNRHATTSNNILIKHTDGTNVVELWQNTLLAGEILEYVEGQGWRLYDAAGQPKVGILAIDPSINQFRLSGVTATPVMTADSTSLSTIYLCSYKGNSIALYDGAYWQLVSPSSEPNIAVTGRTTDLPFDVFAYLSSGAVTLELLDWTNSTTRATGLTRVNGVWTKTGDATRRYLGSVRARSATTFHWVMAGVDLPCKLDLFNAENRVEFRPYLKATTDSWTYTTATIRQAQASTNYQMDVMVGLQEEFFEALLNVTSKNSTISIPREVGIGFDSTTVITGTNCTSVNTVLSVNCSQSARMANQPAVGRHFYAWLEISDATGTCTWLGDNGALRIQSGMIAAWNC